MSDLYTIDKALRDAAPELLAALRNVMPCALSRIEDMHAAGEDDDYRAAAAKFESADALCARVIGFEKF